MKKLALHPKFMNRQFWPSEILLLSLILPLFTLGAAQSRGLEEGGTRLHLSESTSACHCDKLHCGKVMEAACHVVCEPPKHASCICGHCEAYYRKNQCLCTDDE